MDSTLHALFFCAAIKHLWKNTSFSLVERGAKQSCTLEMCLWLKVHLPKSDFEDLALYTWTIWREKQNFLHSDKKKLLAANVSWSSAILPDLRKALAKEKIAEVLSRGNTERIWTPPSSCALKLNVDAAVNKERHQFSICGVVRKNQSRLLLAFGKYINQLLSAVHGELLAIQEGIILLFEKGFADIQVVSDSLLAVQTVTNNQDDLESIGPAFDETCDLQVHSFLSLVE